MARSAIGSRSEVTPTLDDVVFGGVDRINANRFVPSAEEQGTGCENRDSEDSDDQPGYHLASNQ